MNISFNLPPVTAKITALNSVIREFDLPRERRVELERILAGMRDGQKFVPEDNALFAAKSSSFTLQSSLEALVEALQASPQIPIEIAERIVAPARLDSILTKARKAGFTIERTPTTVMLVSQPLFTKIELLARDRENKIDAGVASLVKAYNAHKPETWQACKEQVSGKTRLRSLVAMLESKDPTPATFVMRRGLLYIKGQEWWTARERNFSIDTALRDKRIYTWAEAYEAAWSKNVETGRWYRGGQGYEGYMLFVLKVDYGSGTVADWRVTAIPAPLSKEHSPDKELLGDLEGESVNLPYTSLGEMLNRARLDRERG